MGVFLRQGLQGYWTCNDASGDLIDVSGFGNDASPAVGAIDYGQSSLITEAGGSSIRLNFGGGTSYFSVPATNDLNFGDESFSISLWSNQFNESGGSGAWVQRYVSTNQRSYNLIYISGTNTARFLVSPDGTNTNQTALDSTVTMTVDGSTTYHIVAIHDAQNDQLRIYVSPSSGSLDSGDSIAHTDGCWDANTNAIEFGRHVIGGNHIHGNMDEIGIWRRALNDAEIEALFNEGEGLPFSQFRFPGGMSRQIRKRRMNAS